MKKNYFFTQLQLVYHKIKSGSHYKMIITFLVLFCFSFSGYAQKSKDILPLVCVKKIDEGLYQATFSYKNPTKKEVVIDENGSIIKSNNGKRVAKGLNKFKPGVNKKAFTKEFGAGDFIKWTITSNGNTHEVVANVNSGYCEPDDGFIFPVYGQDNGKNNNLIGSKLRALAEGTAGSIPSPLIFQITENKVLVEIVSKKDQIAAVLLWLETYVAEDDYLLPPASYLELSAIDVYFPIDKLFDFNGFSSINFVRPLYPSANESIGDEFTGESVSQGDTTQASYIVRQAFKIIRDGQLFPVDGSGVKVGVLSNSYDTQPATGGNSKAATDVLNGDLPADVSYVEEWPFGVASDEGRAMMQIIHDIAPGASLAFHSASISPRNFEVGLRALKDEGCQIIVDDITFITEPFFGEGRISGVIKELAAQEIMHFTSAGNFGNAGHQGVFSSTETLPTTNFITESTTRAHVFDEATGDYLQKISVKGGETYMLVLQWADQVSASQDNNSNGARADLDFYIVDDLGRLLVGNNRSNEAGDAAEIMVFTASADGEANIMITSANGPVTVPFRYIAFKSAGLTLMQYNEGTPTISGHAMTEASVTVGAIRFNKTEPEPFSSYGGDLKDGTTVSVDIAAPDGVNTTVASIGTSFYADGTPVDGDPFPNFFGTSAAAPSAAAAMALLQSALPVWYPDGNGGSTISKSAAIKLFKDNGLGGTNPLQTGGGMIDVNKVFKSLASETARITSFTIETELNEDGTVAVPSVNNIEILIIGEFFPPPPILSEGETNKDYPIVYFDNKAVDYTVNEDGSITAHIGPFSGNPELQIYTEPKENSENNGGFSKPYSFYQDGRIALNITVNDVLVKYGEDYRSKMSYSVVGIPKDGFPGGKTFEEYFPELVLSSAAADAYTNGYPDVNPSYVITAAFGGDGLSQEQLDNYQINFIKNGNLTVEKNFLTIKPNDQDITYGDIIDNTFSYQLTDEAGVAILEDSPLYENLGDFYEAIANAHDEDFYYDTYDTNNPQSIMLLINDFNDDSERYSDITTLLEYGGWVSSENAILNGLIRQRNIMNDMRQSAILNDFRQKNIMNDFRQSALMNTLRIDKNYFTNYIDGSLQNELRQTAIMNDEWVARTSNIMNELRQTGIMNDFRQSAVMNDMRVGAIMNIIDIVDLNVDAIVNGQISRQLGVMNELRQSAIMNNLRQSTIMNEEGNSTLTIDKIFSLIDYTDVPTDENDINEIQKFYALNLITGIDATSEGEYHFIFPGAFLDDMAYNFNIVYDKALVTIDQGTLQVTSVDFESSYGTVLTDKDIPTTFSKTANYEVIEAIFPDGIPYYFMKEGDPLEYTLDGEVKMGVGVYDIFIRDEAANYNIEYGESHGQFTIVEAALEVTTTTAPAIKYGETPVVTTKFSSFAEGEDETTLFPVVAEGGIPYYFMKQGDAPDCVDCIRYTIDGEEKMDVGVYNIFVTDLPDDNYKIEHAPDRETLTITEAILDFNPVTDDINYGDAPLIDPGFGDFANTENSDVLKDDQGNLPYYFMKEGDPTKYTIGGTPYMNVGIYDIFLKDDIEDNYTIAPAAERGKLTVLPREVTVQTSNLQKTYGYTLTQDDLSTVFGPYAPEKTVFAPGETVSDVFDSDIIPFYFTDGSEEYEMASAKEAGTYDIRIRETNENYTFNYDAGFNLFEVTRKTLTANIDDLFINQGEVPQFTSDFEEFVNGENEDSVYPEPEGVPYYIVDEYGTEVDYNDPGAFTIKIRDDRKNYAIAFNNAILFINPFNDDVRKIRTFSDCVSYNNDDDSYTVTFRYENDNFDPVFVPLGEYNNLSGPGSNGIIGELPNIFMPGSGTFKIRFNGEQLTWSLYTYGSFNKSSVSSANQSGTGECDAKEGDYIVVYPNPVIDYVTIEQNVAEEATVYILNMYGSILYTNTEFNGSKSSIGIDMSGFDGGWYIVRIESADQVRTYSIIKQ